MVSVAGRDGEHGARGAVFLDLDFLRRQIGGSSAFVVDDRDVDVPRDAFADRDRRGVLGARQDRAAPSSDVMAAASAPAAVAT